jgi:Immunity protein 8
MRAVLKGLHSTDVADVEGYRPERDDSFGIVLRAMVGPTGEPGEESFDIAVCTPKWLIERHGDSEVLLGLHRLIVFKYDYPTVRKCIQKYLMRCSGETWAEVARKVGPLGQREFEGYRPKR